MGRVEGKVAFITGAARGQGRSNAVRLAQEGADIIAVDICGPVETSIAPPSTKEDLDETVRLVEALDRRAVARVADVRDFDQLKNALDDGVAKLGRLDIVSVNAGMWNYAPAHEISAESWKTVMDVDLTGAWHTAKAAIPLLVETGAGGSITFTSSAAGLMGFPYLAHYVSAKTGMMGLMRTLANELAPHKIRVNVINPCSANTLLIHNKPTYELFAPDIENPTREQIAERFSGLLPLGVPWIEPEDVSNALLFLSSDEARYITGSHLSVDAGQSVKSM
jgi:(+)-trans-carveol dehydrogenase